MTKTKFETLPEATLNERESVLARESGRALAALLDASAPRENITLHIGSDGMVALPMAVLPFVARLLEEMAKGNEVALLPVNREVSTFEAADILSVSRPYLIKLLGAGTIPFRRVGTHRRIVLRDLLEYKRADDARRAAVLDELVAETQELGKGY